ncbi:MAG: signal recognition particle-docking protein FtsY [Myxococcales bacterium]|nr:signal recognition particle-docking protein FtsY [Myxococcales bacterium]
MAPPRRHTRDVAGLRQGLSKMRGAGGFFGRLKELFVGKAELAPNIIEQLEEVLLTSDVGVKTTALLLEDVRLALKKKDLASSERVWERLRERATELLEVSGGGPLRARARPTVVLIVGVNGTGKTTTIGKLATKLTEQGKTVLLVAGDTFRAAAVQQLQAWGKRVGCAVHAGADGADPASVTFEAIARAMREKPDFVLIDTAGRLHTKSNLMDELRKIERTAAKGMPGAPHETLLVVDGTTGQNALQQVAEFGAALPLTGLVLTKLDGTAKGGCVLAIASEHNVPVRYIGLGERAQDLREFDAGEFVEALLGHGDDSARAA